MELSWSTFILEIVNFLALVWLLKRFLYRPVLDVIGKRRAQVEKTLADADGRRREAAELEERYQSRLADWDVERRQARAKLAEEISQERAVKLDELRDALERERQKAEAVAAQRQADLARQAGEAALVAAARFAARLLEQAAGPELEARLVELFVTELEGLSAERRTALEGARAATVRVATAFGLSEAQRARVEEALRTALSEHAAIEFSQAPDLIAGVRATVGAWTLGLNVRDELEGFARLASTDG